MLVYLHQAFVGTVVGLSTAYSGPDLYRPLSDATDIAVSIRTWNVIGGAGAVLTVLAQSSQDGVTGWLPIVISSFTLLEGQQQYTMASLEDAFRGPFARIVLAGVQSRRFCALGPREFT